MQLYQARGAGILPLPRNSPPLGAKEECRCVIC